MVIPSLRMARTPRSVKPFFCTRKSHWTASPLPLIMGIVVMSINCSGWRFAPMTFSFVGRIFLTPETEQYPILVSRIFPSRTKPWMLPSPGHRASLPCGRYLFASLTGNKEGGKGLMILRDKPTPIQFLCSLSADGQHTLAFPTKWGSRSLYLDQGFTATC